MKKLVDEIKSALAPSSIAPGRKLEKEPTGMSRSRRVTRAGDHRAECHPAHRQRRRSRRDQSAGGRPEPRAAERLAGHASVGQEQRLCEPRPGARATDPLPALPRQGSEAGSPAEAAESAPVEADAAGARGGGSERPPRPRRARRRPRSREEDATKPRPKQHLHPLSAIDNWIDQQTRAPVEPVRSLTAPTSHHDIDTRTAPRGREATALLAWASGQSSAAYVSRSA